MNNKDTSKHLREWVAIGKHGPFAWPTDACGYDQHIKFVLHRNKNWEAESLNGKTFEQFVLDYADSLEEAV